MPYHYAHKPTGRPVVPSRPDAFYTTRYLDTPHTPLYPFGHGLGYGDVVYEDVSVSPVRLPWNGALTVTVRVTNRGARDTVETVQLYVHDRVASITRPVRELKAFRRVPLAAGASATVTFRLDRTDLRFIGPDGQWVTEPGAFDVWIAPSAGAGQQAGFMLEGPTQHHVGER